MDLDSIILSETSQRRTNTVIGYVCNLKNKTKECIKQNRNRHRYREQTLVTSGEREERRGKLGVWD